MIWWIIILLIICLVLYLVYWLRVRDRKDLEQKSMFDRFYIIINAINDEAFEGKGKVGITRDNIVTIYKDNAKQSIHLKYMLSDLHIIWFYKYQDKEITIGNIIKKNEIPNVFMQKAIISVIIQKVRTKKKLHRDKIHQKNITKYCI